MRYWLEGLGGDVRLLVEPFAGGWVVSLTTVMEGLARSCLIIELHRDLAAVWHSIKSSGTEFAMRASEFERKSEFVEFLLDLPAAESFDRDFRTLVIKHMRRGEILAVRASFNRVGENRNGIDSHR